LIICEEVIREEFLRRMDIKKELDEVQKKIDAIEKKQDMMQKMYQMEQDKSAKMGKRPSTHLHEIT
tara:strand:- start:482 stop:679 length:198 start_codon:yes stop_codon:yes gene_type:complete